MSVFRRFQRDLYSGIEFFVLGRLFLGPAIRDKGNHQRLELLDLGAKFKGLLGVHV